MKHVAVFRGGTTHEYEHFYSASEPVLHALRQTNRPLREVIVTKDNQLLSEGRRLTANKALSGVDVVLLLLPHDCETRRTLEPLVRHTIPSYGHREFAAAAMTRPQRPYTSTPNDIRRVHVYVVRDFRDTPVYAFPILEHISHERSIHNRPVWLSQQARERIAAEVAEQGQHIRSPLWRAQFRVVRDAIETDTVTTDSSLLFSPGLHTSCEFVGLPYNSLVDHIIHTTTV